MINHLVRSALWSTLLSLSGAALAQATAPKAKIPVPENVNFETKDGVNIRATFYAGLAKKGVAYPTATPAARAALGAFSSGVATLSPVAYQFQGYKFNRAMMAPTVTRVTQAIVGEMSTDEAMTKIAADMADAVKQAQK